MQLEAEQSVLGGLMLNNGRFDDVAQIVSVDDFFDKGHREIYSVIHSLATKNTPFDVLTVSEKLQQTGYLQDVGGMAYIGRLCNDTPSAANIIAYANLVRDRARERELNQIVSEIQSLECSTDEKVDKAQSMINALTVRTTGGPVSALSALPSVYDELEKRLNSKNGLIGVSTGFSDLDKLTCGLCPSDLIIIAGRPSMGKTALAMNMVEHVVFSGGTALVFSLEMPKEQLLLRMIASRGMIDFGNLRTADMDEGEWKKVTNVSADIGQQKLFIDETPGASVNYVRSEIRKMHRDRKLDLVVIDYLGLMTLPDLPGNKTDLVGEITRQLKNLAKELSIPIVLLSQLNRGVESRPNKRPVMSDLRDSGSIEQDGDLIMFAYRDDYYNEDSPDKGSAEIIIGKQRNGPTETVRLGFRGLYCRFDNYCSPRFDERYG